MAIRSRQRRPAEQRGLSASELSKCGNYSEQTARATRGAAVGKTNWYPSWYQETQLRLRVTDIW